MQSPITIPSLLPLDLMIDRNPVIVLPHTSLLDVINIMAEQTNYIVVKEGLQVIGVVTERQLLKILASGRKNLDKLKIVDVISQQIPRITYNGKNDLSEILAILKQHDYLQVIDQKNNFLGMITPQSIIQNVPSSLNNYQLENEFDQRTAALRESNDQLIAEIVERKQTEKALRESEERYRLMTENSTDMISRHNLEGIFLYVSPACSNLLGYEPEDMIGHSIYDFFHPQDLPKSKTEITNILTSQNPQIITYRMRCKNGNYIWLETTSKILHYTANQINTYHLEKEIICVSRNITERKQAEKELRNAKEQLAVLLDAVPGTVSWVSADLRYIGVNKQLAQIFQRPPEDFIGQPLGFLEQRSHFAELMRVFFASSDQELSLELSTPNGQSYLIVGQKYNQNKSAFTVGIDITERKQAEQQLQTATSRLTTLIKNLQAGILLKDESRNIILINQQFCTMFGLSMSPEEMIGQNFDQFLPSCQKIFLDSEKFVQGLNKIRSSRELVTNEELYLVDGKIYERDYIPIFVDDNYSGHLWMYRDITERKRAERELLKTQAELQQALAKEKELNELKSRFVTMTSHEFRTPLSTILSSAELLEYYRHQWPLEKQNKHLKRIQSSVKHMTQLLNDVLIIGRAEADQLEFYPTSMDIIQFCQEFLEEIQLSNRSEQSIIFNSECTISIVELDEKLLRQILTNLLSNAIKYSPDDGVIHFNLICHPEEVKFSVQDQGIGIPESDKIHLFDSFHRGTNVSNIPGTGLGLAIVKKCVDVYGGTISVETEVGFGTTFFVTLPLQ